MKSLIFSLFATLMLVAGCTGGTLNKNLLAIEHRMALDLYDANSALYTDVHMYKFTRLDNHKVIYVVCGEINAKNGFGAYGGFKRFIAASKTDNIDTGDMSTDDEQEFQSRWNQICAPNNDMGVVKFSTKIGN